MSLFLASILPGMLLLVGGLALLSNHSIVTSLLQAFPRSRAATILLFGLASVWFLYRVWNLSLADFGEYRNLLFVFFLALAALSFTSVPDFLAVRGLAGLMLLAADPLLAAGYMRYDFPSLVLASVTYLGIFAALWLGAQPYRMRDFLEWLFRTPARPRMLGTLGVAVGLLLTISSFAA